MKSDVTATESRKMDEDDAIKVIRSLRKDSLGPENKELTSDRAEAMDRYHGREYGNEEEGSSSVVTRDLSETVDWMMPAGMKVLLQSGDLVEFDPVGDDDVDRAKQETAYVNHVITQQNDAFTLFYDTLKDALLLKNCYAKWWWDESKTVKEREYENISLDELAMIRLKLQRDDVEVDFTSYSENDDGTINMTIKTTRTTKKVRIEPVPPEELRISNRCRGALKNSDFVEHIPKMTRSDLIEMGLPKEWVKKQPAKGSDQNITANQSREEQARSSVTDENDDLNYISIDASMDIMDYAEAYVRMDYDGDGVAELRKIVTVSDKIPPGKEWNQLVDVIPFTGGVIKRVPHRHTGESLNDALGDLAEVHTTLMRQGLDNIYHTNHQQYAINERANQGDFMVGAPGGIKRIKGEAPVDGSFAPIVVQPIFSQILPAIDHINGMKEMRIGINRATTSVDANLLKQTTEGAYMESVTRASAQVDMIIRIYVETFVKPLVSDVHGLLLENQDKAARIKLSGQYIEVNPREWIERTDMTVKVGLGTGTSEEKMRAYHILTEDMKILAADAMVGPKQSYKMFMDKANALGVEGAQGYVMEPFGPEHQQYIQQRQQMAQGQQGNPLAEAEQIRADAKLQSDGMSAQVKMRINQMEMNHKREVDLLNAQLKLNEKAADIRSNEAIEAAKLEVQAAIEGLKLDIGQPGIGAGLQNG